MSDPAAYSPAKKTAGIISSTAGSAQGDRMRWVTSQSTTAPSAAGASLLSTSSEVKCKMLAAVSNFRPERSGHYDVLKQSCPALVLEQCDRYGEAVQQYKRACLRPLFILCVIFEIR